MDQTVTHRRQEYRVEWDDTLPRGAGVRYVPIDADENEQSL